MTAPDPTLRRIVFVTGPSGAGRSSALNVLEDAGFEVIDNLPMRLLPMLFDETDQTRPLALGIDARNRDFATNRVIDLLTPLRARADVLIDTSDLNVHELRAEVEHWFAPGGKRRLTVTVQSFSYKRGLPRSVDMVYDCRFLKNPYWEPALRDLNGTDARVAAHVATDPRYDDFAQKVFDLSLLILPACREEGKSHFSIAFGCTGGQHRSVALAESHALRLAEEGWQVSIRHRELSARQRTGTQET